MLNTERTSSLTCKLVLVLDDVGLKTAGYSLTLTRPFIGEKLVTLLAAAFK